MENQSDYNEIDIVEYLKILKKNIKIIIVFFVVFLAVAYILSIFFLTKQNITAIVELAKNGSGSPAISSSQVIGQIKIGMYGSYNGLDASTISGTDFIRLNIKDVTDVEDAKTTLQRIIKSIIDEQNNAIRLQKEIYNQKIKKIQDSIDFLLARGRDIGVLQLTLFDLQTESDSSSYGKIINDVTAFRQKPNMAFNLICGGLLGLFLGVCWIFTREWWIKNKNRFE